MTMNTRTLARRNAIADFARKYTGQPVQAHVLVRYLQTIGIKTTEATVKKDIGKIIDTDPDAFHLHYGVFFHNAA